MDKVTCEPALALDTITGGHPGPAALAGGNLLPNVLDLQPGPWGESWTGIGAGCLCNGDAWKQGNSCQTDPQLGQLQADDPPNPVPLGEFYRGRKACITLAFGWSKNHGQIQRGRRGLFWAVGASLGYLAPYLPDLQLPSEFKERQIAFKCLILWLVSLEGYARGRAGTTLP